jgi:hypothetical protein
MARSPALAEIEKLDPERDYERISFLSANLDFPWDVEQADSLAFFKTYCVPSISALLAHTDEFGRRPQKRYDDTKLILAEILDHGLDSERGREATRRMNRMHHAYAIANDDFLYVMSTLVFEPIRWNRRFGWRPYTEKEKLAALHYWRALGRRMNILDLPDSLAAFESFNEGYERDRFAYAESNRVVADQTLGLYLGWYSRLLRPLVRAGILALLEDGVLDAFGYEHPPRLLRRLLYAALRLRARLLAFAPRRRRPRLITEQRHRGYPRGYRLDELGVEPAARGVESAH